MQEAHHSHKLFIFCRCVNKTIQRRENSTARPTKTSRYRDTAVRLRLNSAGTQCVQIVTKRLKVGPDCARSQIQPRLPITITLQLARATPNGEDHFLAYSKIYCSSQHQKKFRQPPQWAKSHCSKRNRKFCIRYSFRRSQTLREP